MAANMSAGRGRGRGRGWYSKCVSTEGIIGLATVQKPGGIPTSQNEIDQKPKSPSINKPPSPIQKSAKPEQKLYSSIRKPLQAAQPKSSSPYSNGPVQQKATPPPASDISGIFKKIDSMKKSEVLSQIPAEIGKLCAQKESEGERLMTDFTNAICLKSLGDPDFSTLGAQLCNSLWISEKTSLLLRSPLLSTVQIKYKNRKELKHDQFYGFTVLLCELYKLLRVQGASLKPLNKPVCELLKEMICRDKISEDDAFYLFQEIERIGDVIESDSKENMDEIMNLIREICISNDRILPSTRCRFVQLIELRASKWRLPDQVKTIYDDMNQDLMAEGR